MTIEAYSVGFARIFNRSGIALCDIHLSAPLKGEAERGMRRLHIERCGAWEDFPGSKMSRARIRFMTRVTRVGGRPE